MTTFNLLKGGLESVDNEWRYIKDKPSKACRVEMLCKDGLKRTGDYDPDAWFCKWIIDDDNCENIIAIRLVKWRELNG